MKLDLAAQLRTIDGKPFQRPKPGARMTQNPDGSFAPTEVEDYTPSLKEAIFGALTGGVDTDRDAPIEQKMKLGKLAHKVSHSDGITEFGVDDVALFRERGNKVYSGIQFFYAYAELLEGVQVPEPKPMPIRDEAA